MGIQAVNSNSNINQYSGLSKGDPAIKDYQSQIQRTNGKLKSLEGENGMSPEEKEEMERKLRQEIAKLNEEIRRQKEEDRQKLDDQKRKSEEQKKAGIEEANRMRLIDEADVSKESQMRQYENQEEAQKQRTEDARTAEFMKTLAGVQGRQKEAAAVRYADKDIEHQRQIDRVEIKTDKRRGRDTSRREEKLENIEIDVRKLAKKSIV